MSSKNPMILIDQQKDNNSIMIVNLSFENIDLRNDNKTWLFFIYVKNAKYFVIVINLKFINIMTKSSISLNIF